MSARRLDQWSPHYRCARTLRCLSTSYHKPSAISALGRGGSYTLLFLTPANFTHAPIVALLVEYQSVGVCVGGKYAPGYLSRRALRRSELRHWPYILVHPHTHTNILRKQQRASPRRSIRRRHEGLLRTNPIRMPLHFCPYHTASIPYFAFVRDMAQRDPTATKSQGDARTPTILSIPYTTNDHTPLICDFLFFLMPMTTSLPMKCVSLSALMKDH